MDTLNYIFSFLCSQNPTRSFAVGAETLPLCQRCTGLYLGLGLTFIYLTLTRDYRKGLPTRTVLFVNILSIIVMVLFGTHIIDPGPQWRLWSGLIFANALIYLIFPAAWQLRTRTIPCNSKPSLAAFIAFFAAVNIIPLWLPLHLDLLRNLVCIIALLGLIATFLCITSIALSLLDALKKLTVFSLCKGLENE